MARIARCSGESRRNPRSSWSRSATVSRSSGAAGPSTGRTRRFAMRRRSRVAWAMQTLTSRRCSHASNRSGSRRPSQVTPGDHQRVLEGILGPIDVAQDPLGEREEPVAPNADQVDVGRLDPRSVPPRRDRDPRAPPCRRAQRGRRPTTMVRAVSPAFKHRPRTCYDRAAWEGRRFGMVFYPWVVIAHVVFVILAFGAHGVSAFAMFRVKRETDRARIGAVLDLSTSALVAAGIGLHPRRRPRHHRRGDRRLLRAPVAVGLDRRRRRGLDRDDPDGRRTR